MMKFSLAILMLSVAAGSYATDLDMARVIASKTNTASTQSQKKINKSADAALLMKADIEQLQEKMKNLTVYRDHMIRMVDNQKLEILSFNSQIQSIKDTRQGVVPLMYKMIDGLKVIAADDKPIKREQRLARVTKLDVMMAQADISDAEKYRRILEAYQIEIDYGTKLGVYQGKVALDTNESIEADLLYLGRISLVARSLDGTRYWAWNNKEKGWQVVDNGESSNIDKAFAIAEKQVAPSLITLPVSAHLVSKKAAVQQYSSQQAITASADVESK